jgi:FkbM family methyltransferase
MKWLIKVYPLTIGRGRVLSFAMRNVTGFEIGKDAFGNLFLLDLDNYIDSRMFLEGSYEDSEVAVLKECIEKYECRSFIDVGANIGSFAVPIAAHPRMKKVYAFEPDPRNYAQLLANIFLNNQFGKVILHNCALSSVAGESVLYLAREAKIFDSNKFNSGANSMAFKAERHSGSIEVRTERLDDVIQLKGQSLAIKIDVEGHEPDVLRGMESCLSNNICIILVESFPEQFQFVNDYLGSFGYRKIESANLSPHNYIYLKSSSSSL